MRFHLQVFAFGVLCAMSAAAHAGEKRITEGQLPENVKKTVQDVSRGATIRGYSKETENGQIQYEVEMTVDGHTKDVSMDPDGRVLEVEEQVELGSLPDAVQQALKKRAGTGTITKIESLTKGDKLVAYEAQVSNSGRRSEVQVGPNGEKLAHEE